MREVKDILNRISGQVGIAEEKVNRSHRNKTNKK